MDDLYLRAIQGTIGCKTTKDAKVAATRARFAKDFDSSINVVYDALRNDTQQDLIIAPTKEQNKFTVFARPGDELKIGDILYWNKLHWLMTDIAFDDEIYTTGTMVRCNRQISWMNSRGQIIKRWCLTTKPYTANVETGQVVSVLKGKYDVKLPYDQDVLDVPVGKRFMLDIIGGKPMCYKLDFADVNTNKYSDIDGGFVEWNLTSDQFNKDTDDVVNMICDFTPMSSDEPDVRNRCRINGKSTVKAGCTNTYTPVFYDAEYNPVTVTPVWDISISDAADDKHILHSVDEQGRLKLSVDFVESVIGHTVTITLLDKDGKYEPSTIDVKVVSIYD